MTVLGSSSNGVRSAIESALRADSVDRQGAIICRIIHRDPAMVLPLCRGLVLNRAAKRRFIGAWIMAEMGSPECPFRNERISTLSSLLSTDPVNKVRARAAHSLGLISGVDTQKLIASFAGDPSKEVRLAVAQSLRTVGGRTAEKTLTQLTFDTSWRIREWAAFSLGNLGFPLQRKTVSRLTDLLGDRARQVRYEAIRALISHRHYFAVRYLRDALLSLRVPDELVDAAEELGRHLGADG